MGDPAKRDAARVEFLTKEESQRRNYILGRWGHDAVLDDPHWTHYDNDKVAPLSLHRSPFGLGLADIGMAEYRRAQAEGGLQDKPATSKSDFLSENLSNSIQGLAGQPATLPPKTGMSRSCSFSANSNKETFNHPSPPKSSAGESVGNRGVSRRSLSAKELPVRNLTATTPASLKSHISRKSIRSKIGEAVERELSRSALADYVRAAEEKKQRERQKQLDMPLHLRTGENPISNGCLPNLTSEQMRALALPIQMATDPKWSTDLKRINGKVGLRLEWERKISGSLPGQLVPELKYMPPRKHVSNPPTPYFVPGQAHLAR